MTTRTEDEIRDCLVNNLHLVESGLSLIKKEEYLPNDKGAAGFVDIFAKAHDGKLVIIEIKRSDAAARQAVQELSKYAALLKAKRLIKETEYRLLVLSTDWHELLTPFSEFIHATKYDCSGRKITLGNDGLPVATEAVELLPPKPTRNFSKRHYILEFKTEKAARTAISDVAEHMREAGLTDFIVALVTLTEPVDGISHLLYFAQQELSFDEYMALIRKRFRKESIEEFEAWISDMPELEDRIGEAADKVWDSDGEKHSLYRRTRGASGQISHPEKARYWLVPERASKIEIGRFGRFDDTNLSDETILKELKADQTGSDYRIDASAHVKSRPEMESLLAAADNVFFFNSVWRGAVRDLCDYAAGTGATTVKLKAFSNDDILSSMAGVAIGDPGRLPGMIFEIIWADRVERYNGFIEWNGQCSALGDVLRDHFDNDTFSYFMHRHLGTHRSMNSDLMDDFGLSYGVWKEVDGAPVRVRVQGSSVVEVRRPLKSFSEFVSDNGDLLGEIVNLFLAHDHAFIQEFEKHLETTFVAAEDDLETRIEKQGNSSAQWIGDLENCDICGRPFDQARFMVDAHLQQGGGACLCALCFQRFGTGLGWGQGQLYQKSGEEWLLVAGGPPADETA